jgi:hypothetical protein
MIGLYYCATEGPVESLCNNTKLGRGCHYYPDVEVDFNSFFLPLIQLGRQHIKRFRGCTLHVCERMAIQCTSSRENFLVIHARWYTVCLIENCLYSVPSINQCNLCYLQFFFFHIFYFDMNITSIWKIRFFWEGGVYDFFKYGDLILNISIFQTKCTNLSSRVVDPYSAHKLCVAPSTWSSTSFITTNFQIDIWKMILFP